MAVKNDTKLQKAKHAAEEAIQETNKRIDVLGERASSLYISLNEIQSLFDTIRNIPGEQQIQYKQLKKVTLEWKQQADKIQKEFDAATVTQMGTGAAGIGVGTAIAALGPSAAMGVATTFGVASTGTAISTLSGAAATNAALAWLGGGTLIAGGGGMAAGQAFIALLGPTGWAIAGVALAMSGLMIWKNKGERNRIEDIFTLISERDVHYYDLAMVEINERISRIVDESNRLHMAVEKIRTFGTDYSAMTEAQQYELGAYVNLMFAATGLLTNPIMGLQPKYSEVDYNKYLKWIGKTSDPIKCLKLKSLVVALSNFLYKVEFNDRDKSLLWKVFRNNTDMLDSLNVTKDDLLLTS